MPAYKANEILYADALNRVVETAHTLERDYGLDLVPLPSFQRHQVLTADALNRIMERISQIRRSAGFSAVWEHFPVQNGQKLGADEINELSANLNELVRLDNRFSTFDR